MGADDDVDPPAASAASVARRAAALVAAGQQRDAQARRCASGAMRSKCWRARISVGAISAACRPASTTLGHRQQRDHRLARADVALQQPQHALVGGEIGADLGERCALRAGERKRQGRLDLRRASRAVAGAGAAARCRACGAHQQQAPAGWRAIRHRRAGRGARRAGSIASGIAGRCMAASAAAKAGSSRASTKRSARAIPAGPAGACSAASAARAPAQAEPFGQPVDRLDRRQARQTLRRRARGRDGPSADARPRVRACRKSSGVRRPAGAARSSRGWRGRRRVRFAGVVLDEHP